MARVSDCTYLLRSVALFYFLARLGLLTVSEIQFRSDVTVELVRASANDADVLFAARVSTQGEQTLEGALKSDADTENGKTGVGAAIALGSQK